MVTISDIKNRITNFKSRSGWFSIGKIEFFILLMDIVLLLEQVLLNQQNPEPPVEEAFVSTNSEDGELMAITTNSEDGFIMDIIINMEDN